MRHLHKVGSNPGVPTPKRGNAIAVPVDDVLAWPTLNADGVSWDGNFVFKEGTGFIEIYMTPSTQKATLSSEGSPDAYGSKGKFEGEYPGTPKEAMIFVKKNSSRGFVIFYGGCDTDEFKTMGTKCLPMILKTGVEDTNEKNVITLTFEQEMINDQYIRFYTGSVDFTDGNAPVASVAAVALELAKGMTYQLPAVTDGTAIDIASSDLPDGAVVSLIGGGGTNPAVLATDAVGNPAVLLTKGNWTALAGATISLRVAISDKTYLVEVART